MKETNIKIRRYEHGDFYIDIVDQGDIFEAWLQHKDYGIAEMMFGICKCVDEYDKLSYEDFLDLVSDALEEYEETYYNEHILEESDEDI